MKSGHKRSGFPLSSYAVGEDSSKPRAAPKMRVVYTASAVSLAVVSIGVVTPVWDDDVLTGSGSYGSGSMPEPGFEFSLASSNQASANEVKYGDDVAVAASMGSAAAAASFDDSAETNASKVTEPALKRWRPVRLVEWEAPKSALSGNQEPPDARAEAKPDTDDSHLAATGEYSEVKAKIGAGSQSSLWRHAEDGDQTTPLATLSEAEHPDAAGPGVGPSTQSSLIADEHVYALVTPDASIELAADVGPSHLPFSAISPASGTGFAGDAVSLMHDTGSSDEFATVSGVRPSSSTEKIGEPGHASPVAIIGLAPAPSLLADAVSLGPDRERALSFAYAEVPPDLSEVATLEPSSRSISGTHDAGLEFARPSQPLNDVNLAHAGVANENSHEEVQAEVHINGGDLGSIPLRISSEDLVSVRLSDLISLFEDRIDRPLFVWLRSSDAASGYVTLETLRSAGIRVGLDPVARRVELSLARLSTP